MIVIVDYGMGNLKSVANASVFLGTKVKVSDSKNVIKKAKKIIFPGVGNFAQAIKELKKRGILNVLKEKIKDGTPFLGICLGMQLLLEGSEEAPGTKGLGVIKGKVKKFKSKNLVVPHMGWNQIKIKNQKPKIKNNKLFKGVKDDSFFYFAHSYYCQPKNKEVILSTTDYGVEFASSLYKDNIWAVQFHPEKSQKLGLKVFNNFLTLC
jgi:glutamine amidotransferase